MNYPLDSLVWIAPTIFLVLMIGIPVIGVFAGWKRAAYWGGGTFVFFLIGVLIWKTAGAAIVGSFKGLVTGLIKQFSQTATITDRMLISVTAPIFFIAFMFVVELILVINYYAWFKRVSGIKADIKAKKWAKAKEKGDKEKVAALKQYSKPQGWGKVQFTTKGKVINMACGGAGLALLLVPSTITFTQALFYTTTSVETRKTSGFASGVYSSLQATLIPFNWMSYYSGVDTSNDYNSLFSLVALSNTKVSYTYLDANGNVCEGNGTVTEALTNVIGGGVQSIIKQTTEGGGTTEEKVDAANQSITTLAGQWNSLVNSNGDSINSVFSSESVSEIMKDVIGENTKTKQTLNEDQIQKNYLDPNCAYQQVYNDYLERSESDQLIQIPVTQQTFDNVVASFLETIIIADGTSETVKAQFEDKVADIASLMFKVV